MQTLFIDHLTVIDCSFLDKNRGLVGESWIVSVELTGNLNAESMILDFGIVKQQIKQYIDELVDHKLLIPAKSPNLILHKQQQIKFEYGAGYFIEHHGPNESFAMIPHNEINGNNLAVFLIDKIKQILPSNIIDFMIHLENETAENNQAYFHYSHGLKQHDGNCQRIAHGHRSKIKIDRNNAKDIALEQQQAQEWQDIYIAHEEDIHNHSNVNNIDYLTFQYEAQQGIFQLTLPKKQCYLVDSETTIENISQYLAIKLKQQYPQDSFKIKLYEGVNKGAISTQ